MIVSRISKVVNPRRVGGKRKATKAKSRKSHARRTSTNPAHMLTLGFLNPKRRNSKMAKSAKKRKRTKSVARRRSSTAVRVNRRRRSNHRRRSTKNPRRTIVVMGRRNGRRRSRNPVALGGSAGRVAKNVVATLVGMAVNRAVLPMLPATFTQNNIFATVSALAVAAAQFYLGSMVSKEFGPYFGLGGAVNAGATALNSFIPQVGTYTGISGGFGVSGLRGIGDLIPGSFVVPQNPVSDGNPGFSLVGGANMGSSYPSAYKSAA